MATVDLPRGETDLSTLTLADDDILRVLEGDQTIDTGVAAHAAINLQRVIVGPNFSGKFGTPDSPIDLRVENTTTDSDPRIVIEGGVSSHIVTANGVSKVTANMPDQSSLLLGSSAQAFVEVVGISGVVNIGAACPVTNLRGYGATLDVKQHASSDITELEIASGRVLSKRDIDNVKLHRGPGDIPLFILDDDADIDTLIDVRGGIFNHRSTGTVLAATVYAGEITPQGAPADPAITTLTLYGSDVTTKYVSAVGSVAFNVGTLNKSSFISAQQMQKGKRL